MAAREQAAGTDRHHLPQSGGGEYGRGRRACETHGVHGREAAAHQPTCARRADDDDLAAAERSAVIVAGDVAVESDEDDGDVSTLVLKL
jgi:hypothetical protein